jgi:hypothetical protein
MAQHIDAQNRDIQTAWDQYKGREVHNNLGLCVALDIHYPPDEYWQSYQQSNVKVKVI